MEVAVVVRLQRVLCEAALAAAQVVVRLLDARHEVSVGRARRCRRRVTSPPGARRCSQNAVVGWVEAHVWG